MSHSGGSVKVIIIALCANLGISLIKFVGAFFTKSAALFAEAIHSMVDSTNQVFLLIGSKKSLKPATEKHPLGYGRESFFWAFMVAVLLFSMGGMFAVYEGVHKVHEVLAGNATLEHPWVGLTILIVSLALEGYSFTAAYKEVKEQNTFSSLWQWIKNTTAAELLVIFLEDLGALLGLAIATLGLLLSWATGNPIYDACGSIAVGVLLIVIAVVLTVEVKSLILGEAPAQDYRSELERFAADEVKGSTVLRFIAIQLGGQDVMISYKIHPGEIRDVKELIGAVNKLEARMKARFPEIRWQFVEPDYDV